MYSYRGFTLIELMLVVAALSLLAGIVVVAINPMRQLAEARDHERRVETVLIWNAIQQYTLNNPGGTPGEIPAATITDCLNDALDETYGICKTDSCPVHLNALIENAAYLVEIPIDPSIDDAELSGYTIVRDTEHNNRITVCAPAAEGEESIYIPR